MKYSGWELNYDVIDLVPDGINNYAFDLPSAMAFICGISARKSNGGLR